MKTEFMTGRGNLHRNGWGDGTTERRTQEGACSCERPPVGRNWIKLAQPVHRTQPQEICRLLLPFPAGLCHDLTPQRRCHRPLSHRPRSSTHRARRRRAPPREAGWRVLLDQLRRCRAAAWRNPARCRAAPIDVHCRDGSGRPCAEIITGAKARATPTCRPHGGRLSRQRCRSTPFESQAASGLGFPCSMPSSVSW